MLIIDESTAPPNQDSQEFIEIGQLAPCRGAFIQTSVYYPHYTINDKILI